MTFQSREPPGYFYTQRYAAQAVAAAALMDERIKQAEREGYVQTFPGHWEERDEAGEVVATFDLG